MITYSPTTSDNLSHIIFVTGGTKSGKSEFAEHLAKKSNNLTYIALSESNSSDKKWQEKVNSHQKRRPKEWKLIETTNLLSILKEENAIMIQTAHDGFRTALCDHCFWDEKSAKAFKKNVK